MYSTHKLHHIWGWKIRLALWTWNNWMYKTLWITCCAPSQNIMMKTLIHFIYFSSLYFSFSSKEDSEYLGDPGQVQLPEDRRWKLCGYVILQNICFISQGKPPGMLLTCLCSNRTWYYTEDITKWCKDIRRVIFKWYKNVYWAISATKQIIGTSFEFFRSVIMWIFEKLLEIISIWQKTFFQATSGKTRTKTFSWKV